MREALESSIGEQTASLFRRIEPLNVIGNIGPLLGLLGTVLGMIMAFYKLVELGGTTVHPTDPGGRDRDGSVAHIFWSFCGDSVFGGLRFLSNAGG